MIFVHKFATRYQRLLLLATAIHVNLGTWTTRTCIAHLPEVVVLIAIQDMISWQVLCPDAGSLIVAFNPLFRRTLKHCHIHVLWINFQHIHQILPGHVNCALFEVVAKRPVAEHLKHGVVIGIMSYLLQVVMLAAHAQAFL